MAGTSEDRRDNREAELEMQPISWRSNVLRGLENKSSRNEGRGSECEKVWEIWVQQCTIQDLDSNSILSLKSDDSERRDLD